MFHLCATASQRSRMPRSHSSSGRIMIGSAAFCGTARARPDSTRPGTAAAVGSTRSQRLPMSTSAQACASDWRTVMMLSTGLSSPPW